MLKKSTQSRHKSTAVGLQDISKKRKTAFYSSSSANEEDVIKTTGRLQQSKKNKKSRANNQDIGEVCATSPSILQHFTETRRHCSTDMSTVSTMADDLSVKHPQTADNQSVLSPSEKLIMAQLKANGEKMDKVTEMMMRMESRMFDLQQENDTMKAEIVSLKTKQGNLQPIVEVANTRAQMADKRSNDNEQYSCNYNLRLYYVDEPPKETQKQCEEAVLKLIQNKLELTHITTKDLDAVHRLGKQTKDGKARAILVRFISRKTRYEVISNKKKLKSRLGQVSSSAVIVEDLTKDNYILYKHAKHDDSTDQCWTKMGKIFVKTKAGLIKQITKFSDLGKSLDPPITTQRADQSPSLQGRHNKQAKSLRSEHPSGSRHQRRGGRGHGWGQSQFRFSQSQNNNLHNGDSDDDWISQNSDERSTWK